MNSKWIARHRFSSISTTLSDADILLCFLFVFVGFLIRTEPAEARRSHRDLSSILSISRMVSPPLSFASPNRCLFKRQDTGARG
ncbi:hypothetical protein BJX70DRAFT_131159 [Aspergillus crustosus]